MKVVKHDVRVCKSFKSMQQHVISVSIFFFSIFDANMRDTEGEIDDLKQKHLIDALVFIDRTTVIISHLAIELRTTSEVD